MRHSLGIWIGSSALGILLTSVFGWKISVVFFYTYMVLFMLSYIAQHKEFLFSGDSVAEKALKIITATMSVPMSLLILELAVIWTISIKCKCDFYKLYIGLTFAGSLYDTCSYHMQHSYEQLFMDDDEEDEDDV